MKKITKWTALLAALALVLGCLASCSDDDDDPSVVSKWTGSVTVVDSMTVNLTFWDDGSAECEVVGLDTFPGTYTGSVSKTGDSGTATFNAGKNGTDCPVGSIDFEIGNDGKLSGTVQSISISFTRVTG